MDRVDSPSATSGNGRDPGYKETVPDPEAERAARELNEEDARVAAESKTAPQGPGESGTLTDDKDSDTGVKADGNDGEDDDAGTSFDGGTPEDNVESVPDEMAAPDAEEPFAEDPDTDE